MQRGFLQPLPAPACLLIFGLLGLACARSSNRVVAHLDAFGTAALSPVMDDVLQAFPNVKAGNSNLDNSSEAAPLKAADASHPASLAMAVTNDSFLVGSTRPSLGSPSLNATLPFMDDNLSTALSDQDGMVSVVGGWLLFHVPGNKTMWLHRPNTHRVLSAIHAAVGASLQICHQAVSITQLRATVVKPTLTFSLAQKDRTSIIRHTAATRRTRRPRKHSKLKDKRSLWSLSSWLKEPETDDDFDPEFTEVRASYELRAFDDVQVTEPELARRVDFFNRYDAFGELAQNLQRALAEADLDKAFDEVTLDDVGFASRGQRPRRPLSDDARSSCLEESLLLTARRTHTYVMILAFVLLVLTTLAGSAVFAVKHESTVPSRLNPLLLPDAAH